MASSLTRAAPNIVKSGRSKIVIIGAGLIGLSTADSLLSRGCHVTVLDARSGPVQGTSFANSGMIHPSQARPWSDAVNVDDTVVRATRDLAERSATRLKDRMTDLGLSHELARPQGCYQIFEDVSALRGALSQYKSDGVEVERPDPAELFGRSALYFAGDLSADAQLYGTALAQSVETQGATVIFEAQPLKLQRDSTGMISVSLGSHRFAADHVILAAGAQTGALLSMLDIACPITPVRGWSVDFEWPSENVKAGLPDVPVMDASSRSAFTPFDDRFRLSGTWGEDSAEQLLRRWAQLIPDVLKLAGKPQSVWSGYRPVSDLGHPIIGEAGVKGLWINSGHGHLGWTLCAGSGELMADMIVDGVRDERFALVPPS